MRNGLTVTLLALISGLAAAGRPLSSDDAGVADVGTCQVEAWRESAGPDRAWVIAPACGLWAGVEFGADFTQHQPSEPLRREAGLALKLAPTGWKLATPAGELGLGLKFSQAWARPAQARWEGSGWSAMGLASLTVNDSLAVHLNLGVVRDTASATRGKVLNLALVWTPVERWLAFGEVQANNKRDIFGGTVSSLGLRWWAVPEQLGLDLTAGRESVSGARTAWTLGLGWYGIGL